MVGGWVDRTALPLDIIHCNFECSTAACPSSQPRHSLFVDPLFPLVFRNARGSSLVSFSYSRFLPWSRRSELISLPPTNHMLLPCSGRPHTTSGNRKGGRGKEIKWTRWKRRRIYSSQGLSPPTLQLPTPSRRCVSAQYWFSWNLDALDRPLLLVWIQGFSWNVFRGGVLHVFLRLVWLRFGWPHARRLHEPQSSRRQRHLSLHPDPRYRRNERTETYESLESCRSSYLSLLYIAVDLIELPVRKCEKLDSQLPKKFRGITVDRRVS